jgi:hypothetical protein
VCVETAGICWSTETTATQQLAVLTHLGQADGGKQLRERGGRGVAEQLVSQGVGGVRVDGASHHPDGERHCS